MRFFSQSVSQTWNLSKLLRQKDSQNFQCLLRTTSKSRHYWQKIQNDGLPFCVHLSTQIQTHSRLNWANFTDGVIALILENFGRANKNLPLVTNFWVRTPDTHSMYIWSFSHVIDSLLSHLWQVLYLTKTASTQHVLFSQEHPQKNEWNMDVYNVYVMLQLYTCTDRNRRMASLFD